MLSIEFKPFYESKSADSEGGNVQKGDSMTPVMRALGAALKIAAPKFVALAIFVAIMPEQAPAQSDGAALDMTWPAAETPAASGPLPPADILAEVRQEGFYPVSRPVHRGRIYVLFAVDQDDMEVKLTVDATTGRVLWVAGAVARIGGPGSYGYRSVWRERAPVPPADIPGTGSTAHTSAGTHHAAPKHLPLPRTRPAAVAGAATDAPSEPQAASAEPAAARSPVTMAPIAPLE
jgi:hypothetical protein